MKRKILNIGIPVFLLSLFAFYMYPWVAIFIGMQMEPDPPKPEVTYEAFPFRLEYEMNGERLVIEDTVICEYGGVGADEGRGKYRIWNQRLASGNERITLRKYSDTKEIYFFPGSPQYYMDDLEYSEKESSFPDAWYLESDGQITSDGLLLADQLLKDHNIKLISWKPSPPIKNQFVSSE